MGMASAALLRNREARTVPRNVQVVILSHWRGWSRLSQQFTHYARVEPLTWTVRWVLYGYWFHPDCLSRRPTGRRDSWVETNEECVEIMIPRRPRCTPARELAPV